NSLSCFAAASWPTVPNNSVFTRNAVRLRAALAAPPGMKLSRSNSTTGTGASGEMRATLPQMNWSSMTSPTTSTRDFFAAFSRWRTRALLKVGQFIFWITPETAEEHKLKRRGPQATLSASQDAAFVQLEPDQNFQVTDNCAL